MISFSSANLPPLCSATDARRYAATMRYFISTALFSATLALAGCQSGATSIPVSPDSEMGRQMLDMDANARAFQNAPGFSKALRDYEALQGGTCADIRFDRLQEPGQKIGRHVRLYTMEGVSPTCGRRLYQTRISFDDAPHTVAKRVEVLERVSQ
ncbi:MAG: hypothetical protein KF911_02010 [Pseudomonadales bacterium]|nr:hypothetical protein [Pseudomonadales bacterium]